MYKRMLVPLDGSKLAEAAFAYAKELAVRLDMELVLFHVCLPEEEALLPMHQAYVERAADIVRSEAEEVRVRIGFGPECRIVETKAELVVGRPAEEILRYADENSIDLILMSTQGRAGIRQWAMGVGADKVLHGSKVPVLLIRSGIPEEIVYDKWPRRTILVPLDGSQVAESVLPHVQTLAKQMGPKTVDIILLKVCEPPEVMSPAVYHALPDSYPPSRPLTWDEYSEQETAKCEQVGTKYLHEVEAHLKSLDLTVRSEVLLGKAADVIVEYANRNPLNLIAMATHGRSELSRRVYGGVASKVLLGSSSPMFVVRPQCSPPL